MDTARLVQQAREEMLGTYPTRQEAIDAAREIRLLSDYILSRVRPEHVEAVEWELRGIGVVTSRLATSSSTLP